MSSAFAPAVQVPFTENAVAPDPEFAFEPDPLEFRLCQESVEKLRAANADFARTEVWEYQPGSQKAFLKATTYEVLYSGERGPGKTDALLMAFAQHVGKGWGRDWRGIIFRRTYPELADIIEKSQRWFPIMFPGAKYNEQKSQWRFPDGAVLMFRNFAKAKDYWSYHGHAYPFIGWEELTNWPDDSCYKAMMSCSRSTRPGIPIVYRATTNPYGVGHGWVKIRFRLDGCPKKDQVGTKEILDAVDDAGLPEPPRRTIFGKLHENKILLKADPSYPQRIRASAANPAMADAWMNGSWDIVAGGMFEHVWDRNVHILQPFQIPHTWIRDRGYDYGSSHPFGVLWFAESDGSDWRDGDGELRSSVRGDIVVCREWYGWNGKPNKGVPHTMEQMAAGIIERELRWQEYGRYRAGPADSSIFTHENGTSYASEMAKPVRIRGKEYPGITWVPADKRPGSRKLGWQIMADRFEASKKPDHGPREKPGLFVIGKYCPQWMRTVPSLPRDEKDMDDVDSDAEDHLGDTTRYRVLSAGARGGSGRTVGGF